MTVAQLREALSRFADDRVVVLDVNLEDCNSDRNILAIREVGDYHPDTLYVFLDAKALDDEPT